MGYILNPQEVKKWIEDIGAYFDECDKRYQSALTIIMEFVETKELEGDSYNKLKKQLNEYHQLIVFAAGKAKESLDSDLVALEGAVGNEYLDEDELMSQIEKLKKELDRYSDMYIQSMLTTGWTFLGCANSLVELYGKCMSVTKEQIKLLEEKLERLYEINQETSGLFELVFDWYNAINDALNDLRVSINGEGVMSSGEWKVLLKDSIGAEVNAGGVLGLLTGATEALEDSSKNENIRQNINDIWDQKTIDRINTLHPSIRNETIAFILDAQSQGINLRITSGYRSVEEQNDLYAQGRTKPGDIVTKAKGGQSYHNFGLAFDVAEIKDGNVLWDNDWEKIAEIGKKHGFEWGGDWTGGFVDKPHYQMNFGFKESQLLEKYNKGELDDGYVDIDIE